MIRISIQALEIGRSFNRRSVLKDITFALSTGDSIAITGKNGSGKSTLVKIIAGVLSPSKGSMEYRREESTIGPDELRPFMGLVSPYLQMYDEFTGVENLALLSRIRGNRPLADESVEAIFRKFGMWERRNDFVRAYSSGMKQRLKYIVALAHRPSVLLLDEPTANLDDEGARTVRDALQDVQSETVLIVATNDEREASWCKRRIHVGQ